MQEYSKSEIIVKFIHQCDKKRWIVKIKYAVLIAAKVFVLQTLAIGIDIDFGNDVFGDDWNNEH